MVSIAMPESQLKRELREKAMAVVKIYNDL